MLLDFLCQRYAYCLATTSEEISLYTNSNTHTHSLCVTTYKSLEYLRQMHEMNSNNECKVNIRNGIISCGIRNEDEKAKVFWNEIGNDNARTKRETVPKARQIKWMDKKVNANNAENDTHTHTLLAFLCVGWDFIECGSHAFVIFMWFNSIRNVRWLLEVCLFSRWCLLWAL